MASTAQNKTTNQTVEPSPTMARFSIGEEEEEEETASGSQPRRRRRGTMADLLRSSSQSPSSSSSSLSLPSSSSSLSPPRRRFTMADILTSDSSDEENDILTGHKRRRFSSTAPSGSQPPPPRRGFTMEDLLRSSARFKKRPPPRPTVTSSIRDSESDSSESESEADDESEDEEVIEMADVVTEVQRRTCTASSRRSPVAGDVAVSRSAVEKNDVTEVGNNASGALSVVFTDPDVLDCPICLDPLCAPVFQCENGHIACDSCCSKVKRKCPSCCMPIGYNRCRAIEKVIESVQVSCRYAQRGCRKTMTYNKKHGHEQLCPYVTCFCPHLSCPFAGSSKDLYLHFGTQHAASTTRFTFNATFTLPVDLNQKHILLQEQHESVIFILNHEVKEHGRAFNVDCVGPSTLKTSFEYQLIAKNTETSLSIQSVPEIYSEWSDHTLKKSYLTVPSDFLGYSGNLSLHVCIKKDILSPRTGVPLI